MYDNFEKNLNNGENYKRLLVMHLFSPEVSTLEVTTSSSVIDTAMTTFLFHCLHLPKVMVLTMFDKRVIYGGKLPSPVHSILPSCTIGILPS